MKRSMGMAIVGAVALAAGGAFAQDPAVTAAPPAAPVVTPAPAATGAAAQAPDASAVAFNRELGVVEERVDDLKEKVFRSKAALMYLREVVATGSTGGGARFSIVLRNNLGAGQVLEGVTFLLDGQIKYAGNDSAVDKALRAGTGLEVHQGSLSPGTHELTATYRIRSTGFNVFSYAKGDTYEIRVRNSFEAKMGEACSLAATLREGAAVDSFKDRARVDFKLNCERMADAAAR
jgi:hypothetical protein